MKQIVVRYFHICMEFKIMLGQDTLTFYYCDMAMTISIMGVKVATEAVVEESDLDVSKLMFALYVY